MVLAQKSATGKRKSISTSNLVHHVVVPVYMATRHDVDAVVVLRLFWPEPDASVVLPVLHALQDHSPFLSCTYIDIQVIL